MGWQDVGQAGEAEHAGDSEEHLSQELGVLRAPLAPLCARGNGGGEALRPRAKEERGPGDSGLR